MSILQTSLIFDVKSGTLVWASLRNIRLDLNTISLRWELVSNHLEVMRRGCYHCATTASQSRKFPLDKHSFCCHHQGKRKSTLMLSMILNLEFFLFWHIFLWRDDREHSDTQHNDIQHNDTQHTDFQHKYTHCEGLICDTQNKWHSAWQRIEIVTINAIKLTVTFCVVMLSVVESFFHSLLAKV